MNPKQKDAQEQPQPDQPQPQPEPQEQPQPEPQEGEQDEQVPEPDPTLSSDNRHSTYTDVSDQFPDDVGQQVEEQPGRASEES